MKDFTVIQTLELLMKEFQESEKHLNQIHENYLDARKQVEELGSYLNLLEQYQKVFSGYLKKLLDNAGPRSNRGKIDTVYRAKIQHLLSNLDQDVSRNGISEKIGELNQLFDMIQQLKSH